MVSTADAARRGPGKDPVEILGRCLAFALQAGVVRRADVEAVIAAGLGIDHPALRALAEQYASALFDGSLELVPPPQTPWQTLLGESPPSTEGANRAAAQPPLAEREAAARAAVAKLPKSRAKRLEAFNLRPTLYRGAAVGRVCLERALAALPGDPRGSAEWAEFALLAVGTASNRLKAGESLRDGLAVAQRADLYRANAARALGAFAEAEAGLAGAIVVARGVHLTDLRFWAEAKAFRASLRRDLRDFPTAIEDALFSAALFKKLGDQPLQARLLSQLASIHEQLGDFRRALGVIRDALAAAVGLADDRLEFSLRHGEVSTAARAGFFAEALAAYEALGPAYDRYPEHRHRRAWVFGVIRAGLRQADPAEAAFRTARDGFLADRAVYDAALVTLDWSLLLLDQNRPEEVLPLAVSMGQAFQALGVARETLASWAIFQAAAERRELTRAVTETVVRTLGEERAGAKAVAAPSTLRR